MSVCQRISEDKRRTSDRIPASVDPQQLPGAAPIGRSRFLGAAATPGGKLERRVTPKSEDLSQRQRPPNLWVRPLPFRRPPNRFCHHPGWGNRLRFRSCRLQCPICPGAYELPKPLLLNPPISQSRGGTGRLLRWGLKTLAGSGRVSSRAF